MTLPGNGAPANGSVTTMSALLPFTLLEKSPLRSSAVGMLRYWFEKFASCRVYSCETKKNSLVLPILKWFGMNTGPPRLKPAMLYR